MIYILILLWSGASTSYSGKAAIAVEFKGLAACQVAAAEVRRQSAANDRELTVAVCARQG